MGLIGTKRKIKPWNAVNANSFKVFNSIHGKDEVIGSIPIEGSKKEIGTYIKSAYLFFRTFY